MTRCFKSHAGGTNGIAAVFCAPARSPFLRNMSVCAKSSQSEGCLTGGSNFELELLTESGKQYLLAELKKSHVSCGVAEQLLALRGSMRDRDKGRLLLLRPSIGRELGGVARARARRLHGSRGQLLCRSRRTVRRSHSGSDKSATVYDEQSAQGTCLSRVVRAVGEPSLVKGSVRALADAGGVSRQAALDIRLRLLDLGILAQTGRTIRWVPGRHKDGVGYVRHRLLHDIEIEPGPWSLSHIRSRPRCARAAYWAAARAACRPSLGRWRRRAPADRPLSGRSHGCPYERGAAGDDQQAESHPGPLGTAGIRRPTLDRWRNAERQPTQLIPCSCIRSCFRAERKGARSGAGDRRSLVEEDRYT